MAQFAGFQSGKARLTRIPALFFSELLPRIDHLGELKVTLYAFWYLDQLEAPVRYLTFATFAADSTLLESLGNGGEKALADALERAVQRGTLLRADLPGAPAEEALYFLNTPRGRAAHKACLEGKWRPPTPEGAPPLLENERPNVFRLYEENIGPLTPLVADALKDAEQTYPSEWIEDAVRLAVLNNVRRWVYVEAILRSWKEKGRHETNRPDLEKDRQRYTTGDFARYLRRRPRSN
jgi:DnaD/phage-associated family protein